MITHTIGASISNDETCVWCIRKCCIYSILTRNVFNVNSCSLIIRQYKMFAKSDKYRDFVSLACRSTFYFLGADNTQNLFVKCLYNVHFSLSCINISIYIAGYAAACWCEYAIRAACVRETITLCLCWISLMFPFRV